MAGTEVIADRTRRVSGWVAIVFGTVFGGFGAVFALVGIGVTIGEPNPVTPFVAGLGALFAAIGGGMVIFGIRSVWLSRVLGVPTLVVPRGEPLYLGGALVAWYHRRGGTSRARRTPRLSAYLVCEERATYRQGTDDHTVTQEVYRRELGVRTDQVPDTVSGQVLIEVPVDAPPSLALTHNRIVWSVQVRVQVPGVPDDTGTFHLRVLPVVAARAYGHGGPAGRPPGAPP